MPITDEDEVRIKAALMLLVETVANNLMPFFGGIEDLEERQWLADRASAGFAKGYYEALQTIEAYRELKAQGYTLEDLKAFVKASDTKH